MDGLAYFLASIMMTLPFYTAIGWVFLISAGFYWGKRIWDGGHGILLAVPYWFFYLGFALTTLLIVFSGDEFKLSLDRKISFAIGLFIFQIPKIFRFIKKYL